MDPCLFPFSVQAAYEEEFLKRVRAARRVTGLAELTEVAKLEEDVSVGYTDEPTFARVAQTLGIFREWKVGAACQMVVGSPSQMVVGASSLICLLFNEVGVGGEVALLFWPAPSD